MLRTIAAAAIAGVMIAAGPAAAAFAGPVKFVGVQYDSPGDDTGSNPSLNKEWFRLKNTGGKAKDLSGWKVRDVTGFVFKFPQGFKLRSGKTVTIHTGTGSDTGSNLYWGESSYVWNNTGDKATLKNKGGAVVDRCTWGDGAGFVSC